LVDNSLVSVIHRQRCQGCNLEETIEYINFLFLCSCTQLPLYIFLVQTEFDVIFVNRKHTVTAFKVLETHNAQVTQHSHPSSTILYWFCRTVLRLEMCR